MTNTNTIADVGGADIDTLRAELARQTGIAVDHCERADAAERMMAELRDRLRIVRESFRGTHYMEEGMERAIDAAIASTAEVAGRWVPARDLEAMRSDYQHACEGIADMLAAVRGKGNGPRRGVVEDIVDVVAERDAAIAARDESHADAMEKLDLAIAATKRADAAERARDEVGIQYQAALAEIARMRPVVEAGDVVKEAWAQGYDMTKPVAMLSGALAKIRTVPGDALGPVVRGAPFDEAATVNPDKLTAALEASGIDSSNVKGGE